MKKQNNIKTEKKVVPGEWLYLAKKEIDVRQIANALLGDYEIEIWEEAGVLEIALAEGKTMDIEHAHIHPKDELTLAFVKAEECDEVFLVTFAPEAFLCAREIMKRIMAVCGGVFCGDTEDFAPIVRGE